MGVQTLQYGQSTEDYLKAIFVLEREGGRVTTKRLATVTGVSAAAASKAVQTLARKQLVKYEAYRGVTLKPHGRRVALETIRHHRLLETFLHDVLGYSWDEVDDEAECLEHHVSRKFIAKIDALLDRPSIDPHGAPIPTADGDLKPPQGVELRRCAAGDSVTIERVRDSDPEMLRYLDRYGMRPGASIEILDAQPFQGPMTIKVNGRQIVVGGLVTSHVLVIPTQREADA